MLALVATFLILNARNRDEKVLDQEKIVLPSVTTMADTSPTVTNSAQDEIPAELNLDVPFTVQAPEANWDKTHEEACEEAAILMANRYFRDSIISDSTDAENGLQEIITWEMKNLGFYESTNVAQTARILNEMLGLKTKVIQDPTVTDIKTAIVNGKLVIVPASGRALRNPFYKQPGPLYHMLLIKGYTADKFITNDAGTKHGANYPYDFATVLQANHDWNDGDVDHGTRQVIIVSL